MFRSLTITASFTATLWPPPNRESLKSRCLESSWLVQVIYVQCWVLNWAKSIFGWEFSWSGSVHRLEISIPFPNAPWPIESSFRIYFVKYFLLQWWKLRRECNELKEIWFWMRIQLVRERSKTEPDLFCEFFYFHDTNFSSIILLSLHIIQLLNNNYSK